MFRSFFVGVAIFIGTTLAGAVNAHAAEGPTYAMTLAKMRVQQAAQRAANDRADSESNRVFVRAQIEGLFDLWEGTRWGLGAPQTSRPHAGKINCGTFVGTILVHAGFNVSHKKLQRQPSELIIKSLTEDQYIRRWRNRPMKEFLSGVREMGPGLYVIGLDYHVGFIAVEADGRVRFIHAGVYPEQVVDEPAAGAREISESRYRVVGKILQPNMMRDWQGQLRIKVVGNW